MQSRTSSTANYRSNLSQYETGDHVGGAVIGALHDEITGNTWPIFIKFTQLAATRRRACSFLHTANPRYRRYRDVWAVINVQDYMGIPIARTQFTKSENSGATSEQSPRK
jgi:hypothetical protein